MGTPRPESSLRLKDLQIGYVLRSASASTPSFSPAVWDDAAPPECTEQCQLCRPQENLGYNPAMRILLAAVLWAAAFPLSAEPFTEICAQQLPPARVQVRAQFAEPKISFALSAQQIKPLSGTPLPGVSLGLTRVETRVQQQVAFDMLRATADGRLCARPQIVLTLVLHRADVYVASELAGEDCLVAAVWHHELRHFAIWQETLNAAASELERMMQSHYHGVVLLGGEEEVRGQIERELQGRWADEVEALVARGDIEHQLLDARDAQEAPGWCDGALPRLQARLPR